MNYEAYKLSCTGSTNTNLTFSDNIGISNTWTYPMFYDYWYSVYYPVYQYPANKTEQAFKIVKILIEKKIIKNITVGKFIELVNEITKEL